MIRSAPMHTGVGQQPRLVARGPAKARLYRVIRTVQAQQSFRLAPEYLVKRERSTGVDSAIGDGLGERDSNGGVFRINQRFAIKDECGLSGSAPPPPRATCWGAAGTGVPPGVKRSGVLRGCQMSSPRAAMPRSLRQAEPVPRGTVNTHQTYKKSLSPRRGVRSRSHPYSDITKPFEEPYCRAYSFPEAAALPSNCRLACGDGGAYKSSAASDAPDCRAFEVSVPQHVPR